MTFMELLNQGLVQIATRLGLVATVGWKMFPDSVKETSVKAISSIMELEKFLEQQIYAMIDQLKAKFPNATENISEQVHSFLDIANAAFDRLLCLELEKEDPDSSISQRVSRLIHRVIGGIIVQIQLGIEENKVILEKINLGLTEIATQMGLVPTMGVDLCPDSMKEVCEKSIVHVMELQKHFEQIIYTMLDQLQSKVSLKELEDSMKEVCEKSIVHVMELQKHFEQTIYTMLDQLQSKVSSDKFTEHAHYILDVANTIFDRLLGSTTEADLGSTVPQRVSYLTKRVICGILTRMPYFKPIANGSTSNQE
uniref:Uncharacterized protein n=1 Tax=Acrobeloides nanus TaxID=290746 RepID=A0A914C071_9BILA